MTDQELKDLVASLAIGHANLTAAQAKTDEQLAKTDAQLAKTDAQLARTDAKLDKLAKMIGGMSQNQGDVAEEFFCNSLQNSLKIGDIKFDQILVNLLLGTKGNRQEFDIILINGKSVAIIEVKYKLHLNDLDQVQDQMQFYKKSLPVYKDFDIYGGVAGLCVPNEVIEQAQKRGLFVLQQIGQTMSSNTQGMRAH